MSPTGTRRKLRSAQNLTASAHCLHPASLHKPWTFGLAQQQRRVASSSFSASAVTVGVTCTQKDRSTLLMLLVVLSQLLGAG